MIETVKKEWSAKVAVLIFIALFLWGIVALLNPQSDRYFGDFLSIYGVMALWGGVMGVVVAQRWGGMASVMGRAILMFAIGLFLQEFGQLAYAYLAFYQHIEVPYPSIGDLGYFGSIPFYIYGVWLLAQASGVKLKLASSGNKLLAIAIPLLALCIGYLLFLQGYEFDWSAPLRIFLDFGYPFGQAIYVSLALLTYILSRKTLGGIMKSKILFILFALCLQFLSDYTFLYISIHGVDTLAGLDMYLINNFMYLLSYFLMTLGLLQLSTVLSKLRS